MKMKKILCLLLSAVIILTGIFSENKVLARDVKEKNYLEQGYQVCFSLDKIWSGGYQATVMIKNTGDDKIENWSLKFSLDSKISNIWNAVMAKNGEDYIVKNSGWNQDIAIGGSVSFGFVAEGDFPGFPERCTVITKSVIVQSSDYEVLYELKEDWGDGFNAVIQVKNISDRDIEDWKINFDYEAEISEMWNAVVTQRQGHRYFIDNDGNNQIYIQKKNWKDMYT